MPSLTIEVLAQMKVKRNGAMESWAPGQRISLPEDQAHRLIQQVGGKVRLVNMTVSDEVMDLALGAARPVYWERTGSIVGPAIPEFLAKVGNGPTAQFWVVVQYEGMLVWVNSNMLRSKRDFETHVSLRVVELMKEPR